MLNDGFLGRLAEAFPHFYHEVDKEAADIADRLLKQADGDVQKALVRARLSGSLDVWWPYVKGSIPWLRPERDAMETFTRQVLVVFHLAGYQPASMEDARDKVVTVLRRAVDLERLKDAYESWREQPAEAAAAGAGLAATASSIVGPLVRSKWTRRGLKRVPLPAKIAAGVLLASALASVPLVVGYTAGLQAEESVRARLADPPLGEDLPR